jgi:hypothetical protein
MVGGIQVSGWTSHEEMEQDYLPPEDRIKIIIQDRDEVLITREQADKLEANGDMATYRMTFEQLMAIIDE